jgi:hypothetical protein
MVEQSNADTAEPLPVEQSPKQNLKSSVRHYVGEFGLATLALVATNTFMMAAVADAHDPLKLALLASAGTAPGFAVFYKVYTAGDVDE